MNIKWVNVNDLSSGMGHGVEFDHDDCLKKRIGPIAFLEGFDWRRGAVETVTVQIIAPDAGVFKESSIDGKIIVNDTKQAILAFLEYPDSRRGDWRKGKISVCFNG